MIGKILDILLLVGRLVRAIMAKVQAAKMQREADALADNPSGWYAGHFANSLHATDAQKADKTDADDN